MAVPSLDGCSSQLDIIFCLPFCNWKKKGISMETGSIADWSMIVVTGGSLLLVAKQIGEAKAQLHADHERSRRELTVKLLSDWTKAMKLESSAIIALANQLTMAQCRTITKREELILDNSTLNRNIIKRCLDQKYPSFELPKDPGGQQMKIDADYVVFLRFIIVGHLNLIESILVAWNSGVADSDTIEEQFAFLLEGRQDLPDFRAAAKEANAGVDVWPSITNFMGKMTPKNAKPKLPVVP